MEFKGKLKGVRLQRRAPNDKHLCVQLLTEDDGVWHDSGQAFSAFWMDDLIEQLKQARNYLTQHSREVLYGYEEKV